MGEWTTAWMLRLRVVVNGLSSWVPMASGVLQVSILQPVLFNISVSDLEELTESLLMTPNWRVQSVHHWQRPGQVREMDCQQIQETHEIRQCQLPSPSPGKEEPLAMIQAGACLSREQLRCRGRWGPGGQWVVLGPAVSPGSREVNSILGYVRRSTAKGSRAGIIPLYSTLTTLCLEYCMHFWFPQYKKDIDNLEQGPCRTTKLDWG